MACEDFIEWIKKIWTIYGIGLYLADVGTDINAVYQYYLNGDIYWMCMTLVFILFPLLTTAIAGVYYIIQHQDYKAADICLWLTLGLFVSPFLPLIALLVGAFTSVSGDGGIEYLNSNKIHIAEIVGYVKLCEAMLESGPQGGLQLYIIVRTWKLTGGEVGAWQYVTVFTSLMALSFAVSTNTYIFKKADSTSRVIFFIFGFISVLSRLLVCCLYSSIDDMKGMFLLPIGVAFLASITIWLVKRLAECCKKWKLSKAHTTCDTHSILAVFLRWLLTALCNCFTASGLLMSSINLAFAIGIMFLEGVPQWAAILSMTLAAFSYKANVLFVAVEPFSQRIGDHWLSYDVTGKSDLY